ncbi:transposase family protein, partial [bacterium]|nr:transposase family protein [bacterium]
MTVPWKVEHIEFETTSGNFRKLHIHLTFLKGSKFKDADGTVCPIHDTKERRWRHLDFFQHECYLHA